MFDRRVFCAAIVVACASFGSGSGTASAGQPVKLATLEWPPYSGSSLPNQGLVSDLIRSALTAKGYTVTIEVVPWERAKQGTLNGEYDGYFPAYQAASGGVASGAILGTPLMVAQPKATPLSFAKASDLRGKTIGVVEGYDNDPEFDKLAASGAITIDPASDDAGSLRKLIAGRIEGAIIDKYVFTYTMHNDDSLKPSINLIDLNPTTLTNKDIQGLP
jgi:polar amino acid transport system substrate-binding protein